VSVKGDRRREPDEQFVLAVVAAPFVRLADAVGQGTIVNDD
jgi:hypothetical protein